MKKNTCTVFKRCSALLLMGLFMLSAASLSGQALAGNDGNITKQMTIESKVLEEERIVTVKFPLGYKQADQLYPVLYLLDGQAHIEHATAAVNFLSNRGLIPQLIIVAVHNIDRTRDFSPVHVEERPVTGGAEKFLGFLSDELIPHIREHLKAADFNILMGHSFGGTFATYALLEKPGLFDGYIAISPYLMFADNHMVKEAKAKLKPEYDRMKYYFMTVGNEPPYFEPLGEFSELVGELAPSSISFDYKKLKAEDHGTIPYISLYSGLRFIYSDWQMPQELFGKGLEAIDEHYKKISAKYMVKMNTPELVINALGYNYIQLEDLGSAIEVLKENVKRYPNSANVYDSLGEAYENNREPENALKYYEKAYKLAVETKHPNTSVYKGNYERMKK